MQNRTIAMAGGLPPSYQQREDLIMSRNVLELTQLTMREAQVLRLVAVGMSAKEAAKELAIAPCTVERHVENVRLKTRTRNRAHMIAYVINEGLLPSQMPERTLTLVGA
jgi:DNA-binding CsgD family transcriptional regulator